MTPHYIIQLENGGVPDTPRLCASKEQAQEIFSNILVENGFSRLDGEAIESHLAAYEEVFLAGDLADEQPDRKDTFNHEDNAVRMWEVECEGLSPHRVALANIAVMQLQGMAAMRDLAADVRQALKKGVEHRRKDLEAAVARTDRTAVELSQALLEHLPEHQHRPSAKDSGWVPLVELLKVLYHPDFHWCSGAGITDMKYLEVRIDTQDLGCLVGNRYGRQISLPILQQGLVAPAFRSMNENNPAGLIGALGEMLQQRFAPEANIINPAT